MGCKQSKECNIQVIHDFFQEAFGCSPETIEEGKGRVWDLKLAQELGQRALARKRKIPQDLIASFREGDTVLVFSEGQTQESQGLLEVGNTFKKKFDRLSQKTNNVSQWDTSQKERVKYFHQGAIDVANLWNEQNDDLISRGKYPVVIVKPNPDEVHLSSKTSEDSLGRLTFLPMYKTIETAVRGFLGSSPGTALMSAQIAVEVAALQATVFNEFNGLVFHRKTQKELTYSRKSMVKCNFIDDGSDSFEAKGVIIDITAGSSSSSSTAFCLKEEHFEAEFEIEISIISIELSFVMSEEDAESALSNYRSLKKEKQQKRFAVAEN
jgi:hypothetical protein